MANGFAPSLSATSAHTGSAHYLLLRAHAQELTACNGRVANEPSGADLVQARAELAAQEGNLSKPE